ncbi:hypothetical protein DPMN_168906 [Dreissena polymorpha]|uniref:SRCR domain-containing protein n=1 Tax=Dreissena polymorpha TaxID=45954 RepID=A0A9D4IZT2_DREPO|nr:hypothetical protein DPMN_168906 [Dreissena polymorpha]
MSDFKKENISSVSAITIDVGCYDTRGYDGNASQQHPPRVKTPDDTAAVETSSSKRATLTAVGIMLGVLFAIGFAVAVTFAVSKDSDNKVEANLTTSGVSMTSYSTTTPSVTSHESTTQESKSTSQAGATTDYVTHVTSRVTTIQGTHASGTSVTSKATTTLQHITTLQGVTTSTLTIMSTTGSTDHSTTSDCEEREFRCIQYRQCVPGARRCDGTPDCLDGSYEWYGCTKTTTTRPVLDLEIRLMDGQSDVTGKMRRGRVEARLPGSDDKFGTVCGDIWTDKEATVVCRSLYTDFQGTGFAYGNAIFGQGSGDVLLLRVQCHGNETNLGQCWSRGIGQVAVLCGHSQDASVSCDGPLNVSIVSSTPLPKVKDIRLSRGRTCLGGLVQMNHDGEWRAVCDDGFGEREATVVFRILGFNAGIGKVKSGFGVGDGLFWLDDVSCYGNETNIMQCQSRPLGENNCDYY